MAWLATTALAFGEIRRRRVSSHRRWMIRSYALALFFATFGVLVHPAVEQLRLDRTTTYTIVVLTTMAINLAVAEARIVSTR